MDLAIDRVAAPTDEVRELLVELDAALRGPYLPEQHHALSVDELFSPSVRFFIARLAGADVGCGGVAFDDGFAEVKRMYTRPAARGRGVAAGVLQHLEREARSAGYSVLRLETGMYQAAAMAFYAREGFRRCDAFGAYAAMPSRAIETSVFYEKAI